MTGVMVPSPPPRRLLFATMQYFPYMGGISTHVFEVARRLAEKGDDITVLTTDTSGKLPPESREHGIHITRVPAWPAHRDYYIAPAILREIRPGRWDIIHIQGYQSAVPPLAMIAALRARIPYVLTFHPGGHDSRLRNLLVPLQVLALRPLLARAKRLIAVANFEIAYFGRYLRLPMSRFTYIPNGADQPRARPSDDADSERPLVLSIGRLQRYKGHQRVIEAFPAVLHQYPGARLRIAGEGPYEDALHRLVHRLQLDDRVEIASVTPGDREAMAELLSRASLVVLMSEFEGHPITGLEVITAGRPLLVSGTSGLQELADRGLARAIPLRSAPDQVGDAIVRALREPPVPSRLELPTWDDCTDRLRELYNEVLGEASCGS